MRSFRLTAVAVSLMLTTALLASCAPSTDGVSGDPTPMFSSDEEAFAAAEATYRAYVHALNAVDLADPATFDDVSSWTSGDLNAADRKGLSSHHAAGVRKTGLEEVSVVALSSSSPLFQALSLAVCDDVSQLDLIDIAGQSIVSSDRVAVQSLTIDLVTSSSSPTGLVIAAIKGRTGEPACDS